MARRKKSDPEETVSNVQKSPPHRKGNPDEITWERPSGTTLTTNNSEETIAHCESLGWKRL